MQTNFDPFCERCRGFHGELPLSSLNGLANGHPRELYVLICTKCKKLYPDPAYWYGWLSLSEKF